MWIRILGVDCSGEGNTGLDKKRGLLADALGLTAEPNPNLKQGQAKKAKVTHGTLDLTGASGTGILPVGQVPQPQTTETKLLQDQLEKQQRQIEALLAAASQAQSQQRQQQQQQQQQQPASFHPAYPQLHSIPSHNMTEQSAALELSGYQSPTAVMPVIYLRS